MRLLGLKPPVFLDMVATGLAVGTAVGRIGDLAIAEHLGSRTDFFLGYMLRPGWSGLALALLGLGMFAVTRMRLRPVSGENDRDLGARQQEPSTTL